MIGNLVNQKTFSTFQLFLTKRIGMKKINIIIAIIALLACNNAFADLADAVVETAGGRTFAGQESDFMASHNMSKTMMYKDAKDAFDEAEWFATWLEENHYDIYKNNVMNQHNFPNIEMNRHNGGLVDAFRHIFWTAQIAKRYGRYVAEEFTDLHERVNFETNSLSHRNTEVLNKKNQNISEGKWKYYEVHTESLHSELKIIMNNLSADIDLYVRKGSKPTQSIDVNSCSSYNGDVQEETCNIDLWQSAIYYIGVFGYQSGSYDIQAFLLDDRANSTGLSDGLTPMDYHNNYIGTFIGSENSALSDNDLKIKVRDYIMGETSSDLNYYNSHTQLPQDKVVLYKSLSNGSPELKAFVINNNNDPDIEYFYNQYPSYFGTKSGSNYSCFEGYTCQDFHTGRKIAVHNSNKSLYYNSGAGWIIWRNNY